MSYLDNFELKFDLDIHPVHTLMSVSGLRNYNTDKIRIFSNDGSYTEIKKGIDRLNAESTWINQFRRFYSEHPDSLFCLNIITGSDKESFNTLDQILIDTDSFLEFKSEIQKNLIPDNLDAITSISPLFYLERISDTGNVFLYIIYTIPVNDLKNEIVYNSIYSLCENSGFFLNNYGFYDKSQEQALLYTIQYVHDGLLVYDTEYPWFQKKFQLIGTAQSFASILIMISTVLFMNKLLYLPYGWLIFTTLIAIGLYIFIVSRKNSKHL